MVTPSTLLPSNVYFDLGTGTNYATGAGTYTSSTLISGDGVDKLILNAVTGGGQYSAAGGADSLVFNGKVYGVNTATMATILGGTGADTLDFNAEVAFATVLGGTDTASLISAASGVTSSTLRGGTGNDTITFAGAFSKTLVNGAGGADSFSFSGGAATGSSIVAGAGNDSIYFSGDAVAATTTITSVRQMVRTLLASVLSPVLRTS